MRSTDPTRTLTIRNLAAQEAAIRMKRVFSAALRWLSLGVQAPQVLVNVTFGQGVPSSVFQITSPASPLGPSDKPGKYVFEATPTSMASFDSYIQGVINQEVLQTGLPVNQTWLSKWLGQAYNKGIQSTKAAVVGQGVPVASATSVANPAHITRANLVYTRSFNNMEGITNAMRVKLNRILADGALAGKSPYAIAKEIQSQVAGIDANRAKLITRTEIVRAHQEAAIQEAELLEAETGYPIRMRWITKMDGRERKTHADRNGKVYDIAVAKSLLGEPNCRCAITPDIRIS